MSTEATKKAVWWLLNYAEKRSERYIEAEECLCELATMPLWKFLLFGRKKALNHIQSSLKKYNF